MIAIPNVFVAGKPEEVIHDSATRCGKLDLVRWGRHNEILADGGAGYYPSSFRLRPGENGSDNSTAALTTHERFEAKRIILMTLVGVDSLVNCSLKKIEDAVADELRRRSSRIGRNETAAGNKSRQIGQPLTTNPFFRSDSRTRSRRSPWSSTARSRTVPPVPHARLRS